MKTLSISVYTSIMKLMNREKIEEAFALLGERLAAESLAHIRLVVCGGASLIAGTLVQRSTRDVDVLALMDGNNQLVNPDPLPAELLRLAHEVAEELDIEQFWLNNGPSRGSGGLFQMGLPEGLLSRVTKKDYGTSLTVYLIDRVDQVCFKVYAAVDGGAGRHSRDLQNLDPTTEELVTAAKWAMTHDVSEGFRLVLKSMYEQLGYKDAAERV